MKHSIFLLSFMLLGSCNFNTPDRDLDTGRLDSSPKKENIMNWTSSLTDSDSTWLSLPDLHNEFNTDINKSIFYWNKLSAETILKSRNEYEQLKKEAVAARMKVDQNKGDLHVSGGEGLIDAIWVTEKIDSTNLVNSVKWIKLESLVQYDSLNWNGWHSAGEYGMQFGITHSSIKDCLVDVTTPYGIRLYDDFDRFYKGRSLPMLTESSFDTLWMFTYFGDRSFSLKSKFSEEDQYPLYNYMSGANNNFPDGLLNPFLERYGDERIKLLLSDLTEIGGYDKELNMMRMLHSKRLQKIEEEERRRKEEERRRKEEERRKKEEPCEGSSNCSYEVRAKLENAGWELAGDVLYYGNGEYHAIGVKPMETGVMKIYYSMDCNCQPVGVKFIKP